VCGWNSGTICAESGYGSLECANARYRLSKHYEGLLLTFGNGTTQLAKDNKFHARTKHINIRYHFICEAVENGKINMQYIPTDDNIVDIFSKPLTKAKFERFTAMLGLGYA
jgi:hypothetical protein